MVHEETPQVILWRHLMEVLRGTRAACGGASVARAAIAAWWIGALALSGGAGAEGTRSIEIYDIECIPKEKNSVVYAQVVGERGDETVRLYFRRLHHITEDFYYVPMRAVMEAKPAGGPEGPRGHLYMGVLPKPQDRKLKPKEKKGGRYPETSWAEWWNWKEIRDDRDPNRDPDPDLPAEKIEREASIGKRQCRDWMNEALAVPAGLEELGCRQRLESAAEKGPEPEEFQRWLEELENEPAEYYAAVIDATGRRVARDDDGRPLRTKVRRTVIKADCPGVDSQSVSRAIPTAWQAGLGDGGLERMVARVQGRTEVLTIGETANWQRGEGVFHWKCDGIVTRIDPAGIYRQDEVCRACVFIVPLWLVGLTSAGATGAVIEVLPPPDASPTNP